MFESITKASAAGARVKRATWRLLERRALPPEYVFALAAAAAAACAPAARSDRPEPPGGELARLVPPALLRSANRGREVLRADGSFVVPAGVRRVWIDVGAHHLETTRGELLRYPDLLLLAIEPLAECWDVWPPNERLIGLPAAVYLERGTMDFHVNADDATSSLAASVPGSRVAALTRTREVRRVPVVRLEDVLAAIPPELPVGYLKTDVQGVDLQVLQSAGPALARVYRVAAEVIRESIYEGVGGRPPTTEAEMVAFMASRGFRLVDEGADAGGWADKAFLNVRDWRLADRLLYELRFERSVY
jgi:FkbM family methyltransferase